MKPAIDDFLPLAPATLHILLSLAGEKMYGYAIMQEVARQAIREYVENHSRAELLDRVLDDELPRYAEALERLGQ